MSTWTATDAWVGTDSWTASHGTVETALTPQSATHAHTASAPTLTQTHVLSVSGTTHAHTASDPALTQEHALRPDGTLHAHTASVARVSSGGATTSPKLFLSMRGGIVIPIGGA